MLCSTDTRYYANASNSELQPHAAKTAFGPGHRDYILKQTLAQKCGAVVIFDTQLVNAMHMLACSNNFMTLLVVRKC